MSDGNTLCAVNQDVSTFDRITLNADGKLTYDDGRLTAVYESDAEETEFVVASFAVEDGEVSVPNGAVVLSADDRLTCLVPSSEYGGDSK